jgi:creatinine amidohydrolase
MPDKDTADRSLYVQKGPATLTEMSGAEVREALKRTKTILIPCGATEDHGPHLPLGTDSMEGREICRRTAVKLESIGCPVVVGPVIPFGTSSFHMAFPGTVSLSSRTFTAVLHEVCMSLYKGGFRNFALVHGHDGNLPSMMVAAQEIVDATSDARAQVLNWLAPLSKVYHTIQTSTKGEGHGGEGETSRLLCTHPELVHPERGEAHHIPQEVMRKVQGPEHVKGGGAIYYATRSYKDYTPHGHIGDPRLAKVETGEKGYAVIVDWLTDVIKRDFFDS